ncbi:hypothetical protein WN55_02344 [Dufourea novaeangliae]|uniref:Uncharacterized protein n=1 Tax=Dufourea novaeangliae TaxID=178035 RepID=A0A154PHD8_DUFNO|nr:hypothetical protein WN55_02344 [Dufourea novaeangliae]
MYGVTKLLNYQTKLFQGVEQDYKKYNFFRANDEYILAMALREPEDIPLNRLFRDLETVQNKHLLTEEPYTSVIEHMMQVELNFGEITTYEMEKFVSLGPEEQSDIRKFGWDQSMEVVRDGHEVDSSALEKEFRTAVAGQERREWLMDVQGAEFRVPVTSRKRRANTLSPTSTKRRKTISKEESNALALTTEIPPFVPEQQLAEISTAVPVETTAQVTLPTLETITTIVEDNEVTVALSRPKKGRRKIVFDRKNNKLSAAVMKKLINNVASHTGPSQVRTTLLSAAELLNRPSTILRSTSKISRATWGPKLTGLFSRHLNVHRAAENEFSDLDIELTLVGGHSSKTAATAVEITVPSKTEETILPVDDHEPLLPQERPEALRNPIVRSWVSLPDIIRLEIEIRGAPEILDKPLNGKRHGSELEHTSSLSFSTRLTKAELKVLLEVHWRQGTWAYFNDIISPANYSKFDAVRTFHYCLGRYNRS